MAEALIGHFRDTAERVPVIARTGGTGRRMLWCVNRREAEYVARRANGAAPLANKRPFIVSNSSWI